MSEKKSLWEKLGIVSEEETETIPTEKEKQQRDLFLSTEGTKANPSDLNLTSSSVVSADCEHLDVVKEAYATLPASTEDIFVVEKLLANFSALPEKQRYETLQSTLETMGKDVDSFIAEAETRKNALLTTLKNHIENVENQSKQISFEIEEAKQKIDSLVQQDLNLKNGLDISKKECKVEIDRLLNIIKVLGGQIGGN